MIYLAYILSTHREKSLIVFVLKTLSLHFFCKVIVYRFQRKYHIIGKYRNDSSPSIPITDDFLNKTHFALQTGGLILLLPFNKLQAYLQPHEQLYIP